MFDFIFASCFTWFEQRTQQAVKEGVYLFINGCIANGSSFALTG